MSLLLRLGCLLHSTAVPFTAIAAVATFASATSFATGDGVGATPQITALRAHPFQNQTARLADDLLSTPGAGTWNAMTGPQASAAILVVVEISGQPQAAYIGRPGTLPRYTLRLQAAERDRGGSRTLLDQTVPLPVLGADGKTHLPFLIRPGGCAGVQLTARLIGPGLSGAQAVKQATLPMACGE